MKQPAQPECDAIANHCSHIRNEGLRRRQAEPLGPGFELPDVRGDGQGDQRGTPDAAHEERHDAITEAGDRAARVDGVHDRAQAERQRIEDQQVIEEPEMRKDVIEGTALRRCRLGRLHLRAERLQVVHSVRQRAEREANRNQNSQDDGSEKEQRYRNTLGAILRERLHTAALDDHAREESGHQEERRHAKKVDDVVEDGRARARRIDPGRDGKIREKSRDGMQDYA